MSSQGITLRHPKMGSIDEMTVLSPDDPDSPRSPQPKKRDRLSLSKRLFLKSLSAFWTVKVCQLLCTIYILVMTFTFAGTIGNVGGLVNPATGTIIDPYSIERTKEGVILVNGAYRPVVAANTFQMVCLAFSRASAFSSYPVLVLVYLSKCRAMVSWLSNTAFSIYMFQDLHELHIFAGKYIFVDGLIHTWFHFVRWWDQGNLNLLIDHRTGITGIVAVLSVVLISVPMMTYKRAIKYETRKLLHYLFNVMGIALAMHVPASAIPNGGFAPYVFSTVLILYTLDATYVYFFMTEKIETTIFQVLPSGVQMTMRVSDKFQRRGAHGGYGYACLPWVAKNQWHAFSLFENPRDPKERQIFMLNCGDWTNAVHAALQRNTVRPVYIMGPFSSPYNNADAYDNQIMVASGIGITPALSIIRAHKDSRRTNLIWAVRDVSMLEFFLEHMYLDHDGWNLIFYTGKTPLNPALEELGGTNVRIIKARPDLSITIPNIIYGIETGNGVPENYLPEQVAIVKASLIEHMRELDKTNLTTNEKLVELTALAQTHGFLFGDLMDSLESRWGRHSKSRLPREIERTDSDGSPEKQQHSETHGSAVLDVLRSMDDGSLPETSRRGMYASQRVPVWKSMRSSAVSLTSTFNPWEPNLEAGKYVKSLDDDILSRWGMLYCGGNKMVAKSLKSVSEEYHIHLHTESFQW